MTTVRRRVIPTATRPVPPIVATRIRFRSLHPPRRVSRDGVRPPFQLDGMVTISVARVRWSEGAPA